MTEQSPQDLLNAMTALLQQAGAQTPLGATSAQPGLGLTQPVAANVIKGIAVPVKVPMGNGNMRVYVSLGAEACANQQAFNAALDAVERTVGPLDIWGGDERQGLSNGRNYGQRGYRR